MLSIIRGGLTLQFKDQPPLSVTPVVLSHTSDPLKFQLLSVEVETLLEKAAIEEILPSDLRTPGFYSRLFLVPTKTGGMRPVINLSILNTYLVIPHFKMETNRSIRASIPGLWTTSLDLSDAYFHIPISPSFRKYLRFVWDNRVFQFRALPFGLSAAPLVFTKIMQAAIAHLHSLAIQIHS